MAGFKAKALSSCARPFGFAQGKLAVGGCPQMGSGDIDIGGSGPTRTADAGRGARALDALLGRKLLCREVPE